MYTVKCRWMFPAVKYEGAVVESAFSSATGSEISVRKNTRSVSPEESYIIISLIIVYYDQHVLLLITQQDINHQTWNIDLTRQLKAKVIYRPIQHVCEHFLWSKVVGAQSVARWCDLEKETNCTLSLLKYYETVIYHLAKTEAECILWSVLSAWRHV